ncbi:MAG: molybdopterin molybdotransferase MoeA [Fulvivirga sp.]
MISAQEAINIVLENKIDPGIEGVNFEHALGRILREDIKADRDFPPFNRVAMDGIAINSPAWEGGRRIFPIEGLQTAGSPQESLSQQDNCIEVMTGAMLPQNTDIVIRYEDVQIKNGTAYVQLETMKTFQNIHLKGTDRKAGEVLIKSDQVLSPAEIAILATVGKYTVRVAALLKVAIVSTGDELVEITATPAPYQIRKSNVYSLQAAFGQLGHVVNCYHIKDEETVLQAQLSKILDEHDLVLLSGGVSKGKKDYVPDVLETLQVKKLFHGVKQRPGKPFWFGIKENSNKTAVFGSPGNPVSTFMCFYCYVKPWIKGCYGMDEHVPLAVLTEDFEFGPDLTYYLQVKLAEKDGQLWATPIKGKGSGDLANLLEADAFLELPAGGAEFKEGTLFPVYRFR